jgi:nitrate/nitrite-specific signal transduction histidine kinase
MKRDFIEKAASDTREVVQSLLDENYRLSGRVAELIGELEAQSRRFSERYVEVEEQNTKLANLYVASYQLNGTLDRARVLDAIKEIIINLIGCEELAIWDLDRETEALQLAGSFGIDEEAWLALPLGSGLIGSVAASGESYISEEKAGDVLACIPLKLDDEVVGAIALFSLLQQKQGLEPLDYELFDLLGSHAASALFCTRTSAKEAR